MVGLMHISLVLLSIVKCGLPVRLDYIVLNVAVILVVIVVIAVRYYIPVWFMFHAHTFSVILPLMSCFTI